jgi:hypothetical protein
MPRSMALGMAARATPASNSEVRAHIAIKGWATRHDLGGGGALYVAIPPECVG